ncbi:MAG: hypothetical protein U5K31_13935 [Balneolaceae bacterium]|nr:hypothetical protein [Balneolaceae bacterium]
MNDTATNSDANRTQKMRERGDDLYHVGLLFWFISVLLDHLEVDALWTDGAIGISYLCVVGGLTVTFIYNEKGGWKRKLNGFFCSFCLP